VKGDAMANGVADGEEKREEDGSHAVECGAIINRCCCGVGLNAIR
jgi:hypothetical protein